MRMTEFTRPQTDTPDSEHMEAMVRRIHNGETALRDSLIEYALPFIRTRVARILHKHHVDDTDEYSVAILAFNESIDAYTQYEPQNFPGFAATVIRRRIIDHQRHMQRQSASIPFSDLTSDDGRPFEESQAVAGRDNASDELEFMEEMVRVENRMARFGLRLEDMRRLTPQHTDTRCRCVSIARDILNNPELRTLLFARHRLPVALIAEQTGLHRKTIEKHRRFIIFLVLLLDSELERVKSFIHYGYERKQTGEAVHEQ